jgi:hypothetical protein
LLLACAAGAASGQNLLVNPGFETGDLSGWISSSAKVAADGTPVGPLDVNVHGGTYAAYDFASALSQNIPVTPGQTYLMGFWASLDSVSSFPTSSTVMSFGSANSHILATRVPAGTGPQDFAQLRRLATAAPGQTSVGVAFWPTNFVGSADDFFVIPYTPKAHQSGDHRRVLASGDPATGFPGQTFSGSAFDHPLLNESGRVAVSVAMLPSSAAVTRGLFVQPSGGPLQATVRGGQAMPGGGTLSFMTAWAMDGQGRVAFTAGLSGTPGGVNDDSGLFVNSGEQVLAVAREGHAAPDGPGSFSGFQVHGMADDGSVLFTSSLRGVAGDLFGMYAGGAAGLKTLMREGALTPDGQYRYSDVNLFTSANGAGKVAFSIFTQPVAGGSGNEGMFLFDGNATVALPRSGTTVGGETWNGGRTPRLGESERIVFNGSVGPVGAGRPALFLRDGNGDVSVLVRQTDAAPDGNGVFSGFETSASLSAGDAVAFRATLSGTAAGAADASGIYRVAPGGPVAKIARAGQATPEGDGTFAFFDVPAINRTGQVAFVAGFNDSANPEEVGLYLADAREILMVQRFGYELDGSVSDTFSQTRPPPAVNAMGQIAYRRLLADGKRRAMVYTPDLHWRDGVSGDWADSEHWTVGLSPAHVHRVVIDPMVALTVTAASGAEVRSLTVGGGGADAELAVMLSEVSAKESFEVKADGALRVQVRDTSAMGRIVTDGEARLDGQLRLETVGLFAEEGEVFEIMRWGSRDGRFAKITGVEVSEDLSLVAVYAATALRLVAATPGDADLDGVVDFGDFQRLEVAFGSGGRTWGEGDFDGDGVVAFADFWKLYSHFEGSAGDAAALGAFAASVPEPGIIGLAGGMALVFARGRRRRTS